MQAPLSIKLTVLDYTILYYKFMYFPLR